MIGLKITGICDGCPYINLSMISADAERVHIVQCIHSAPCRRIEKMFQERTDKKSEVNIPPPRRMNEK